MQKTVNFKKKIIASAIASTIGFSGAAFAQDDAEEIVVTGIKASLTRAMDIKRDAAGVVDAISAEDIGKMPDANLAESLQRISGVSIDRSNGEGSKVTVRGLAGDYNMVTVNNRQMPAVSAANNGASVTRSFDFANLASEGVAGVEVYKTGRSDLVSGGMGALINITTPHPLKNPGLKASVGVKAVFDQSTETGDKATPEVSGLYSQTFADDTVGVSITGSYQKRDNGVSNAYVGGWFASNAAGGDWGAVGRPADANPTDLYNNPVNVGYSRTELSRERINGQATFQYKPVESLTLTADYIYVNQEVDSELHSMGMWFTRGGNFDIQWAGTDVKYPVKYTEDNGSPHDFDANAFIANRKSDLKSAGLNVSWDMTDHLNLEFDGHNSTSFAGPNGKFGTEGGFSAAAFRNYRPTLDISGDFPVLSLAARNPVPQGSPTGTIGTIDNSANPKPELVQLSGNNFKNGIQEADIDQYQLKGTYTFDDGLVKNVKFGFDKTQVENTSIWIGIQQQNRGNWNGVGTPADLPDSLWKIDNLSNYFDNDGAKKGQSAFITFNLKEVMAAGAKLYGVDTATNTSPCVRSYCATMNNAIANDGNSDQRSIETSKSGYLQANLGWDFNGMPSHLLAGLRHESTDVESKSLLPLNSPLIRWNGGNEFSLLSSSRTYFSGTGGYEKLLPSLDYDIGFTDTIKGRASFSKTISRPNYNQIASGLTYGTVRNLQGEGTSNNPDLDPMESTNYDLSAEWYYGDASYVSVGYFKKDVRDFIGSAPERITNSGFHTVVGGDRWNAALASGLSPAQTDQIIDYIIAHASSPSEYDTTDGHKWVYALPNDPILPFTITKAVNNQATTIHGFEVAVQHTFGDSGFGVMANATKVNADVEYDNTSRATQFAILGLSDSANLVAFYDKDGLQGRIAYNWRDEFLLSVGDSAGANPRYVDAYGQLDATVSYEIIDGLTVSLEGLNILDAHTRSHGREDHLVLNYIETGARYNLGVRYNF